MLSLEEEILDHLIDGFLCPYEEQKMHHEMMLIKLAKYRSRLTYMKRRHEEGKQP